MSTKISFFENFRKTTLKHETLHRFLFSSLSLCFRRCSPSDSPFFCLFSPHEHRTMGKKASAGKNRKLKRKEVRREKTRARKQKSASIDYDATGDCPRECLFPRPRPLFFPLSLDLTRFSLTCRFSALSLSLSGGETDLNTRKEASASTDLDATTRARPETRATLLER